MKVLITGANGFIGKNLQLYLSERKDIDVVCFCREHSLEQLYYKLQGVEFVFHLAGVNRAQDPGDMSTGNIDLTLEICNAIMKVTSGSGKRISLVYTSSIHAVSDNPYGKSKKLAEDALFALKRKTGFDIHIFRLPNVFGKWCKPNYNSVVATFCHNIAHGIPIKINDPESKLALVYIDDLILRLIRLMDGSDTTVDDDGFSTLSPIYNTTVGEVATLIQSFKNSRESLMTECVGVGLVRGLYATYLSYQSPQSFVYAVPMYVDERGVFTEMLKTPEFGQLSYFTAHPGITRGGHYHHTKSEKFLVIKGEARFMFRHMLTGKTHEIFTSGDKSEIVETVPGWTHSITNIGSDEMVVILWASEIFDRQNPDTFCCQI